MNSKLLIFIAVTALSNFTNAFPTEDIKKEADLINLGDEGRCGPTFGVCKYGSCSQYGYCGVTPEYFDKNCQPRYSSPESNCYKGIHDTNPGSGETIRDDGLCGKGVGICKSGSCSQYGYCGTTYEYYNKFCQPLYSSPDSYCYKGIHDNRDIPGSDSTIRDDGLCGKGVGICESGSCSQYGYCGTTPEYYDENCQPNYSAPNSNCYKKTNGKPITTTTTRSIPKTTAKPVRTTTKPAKTTTRVVRTTTTTKKAAKTTTRVIRTTTTTSRPAKTTTTTKTTSTTTTAAGKLMYTPIAMKESDKDLNNPYIGWYHGSISVDLSDNPNLDCSFVYYFNQVMKYDNGLQYLGVRLSEYRNKKITNEGLTALDNLLNEYKKRKETVDPTTQLILRFHYDGHDNCKMDKNNKPILIPIPKSNSGGTIKNIQSFKQRNNGYIFADTNNFDYFNKNYNYKILNENMGEDAVPKINLKLSKEYRMKFNNKMEYLNEDHINENNNLVLSEEELNDYLDNSVFLNYNLRKNNNTADLIQDTLNESMGKSNVDLTDQDEAEEEDDGSEIQPAREILQIRNKSGSSRLYDASLSETQGCTAKYVPPENYTCVLYETTEIEPKNNLNLILTHIKQLAPIVNKYKDLIYIYQGAFVGTWGEMHDTNYKHINDVSKIMNTIYDSFDPSIFLSVRTPYHHRAIIDALVAMRKDTTKETLEQRIGLFNDGLFYDKYDHGTYAVNNDEEFDGYVKKSVNYEIDFQDKLCRLVPNGGEGTSNGNNGNDKFTNIKKEEISKLLNNVQNYNNFYVANDHARKIHLSYINDDFEKEVYNHWGKTKKEFIYDNNWNVDGKTYIGRHLGYRYVIRGSSLNNNILTISVENVGYAPSYIKFEVKVAFVSKTKVHKYNLSNDNRKWKLNGGSEKIKFNVGKIIPKLTDKTYDVYFRIHDSNTHLDIKLGNNNNFNKYGYKVGTLNLN